MSRPNTHHLARLLVPTLLALAPLWTANVQGQIFGLPGSVDLVDTRSPASAPDPQETLELFRFYVVRAGTTPEAEAIEQMQEGVARFIELAGELLGPGEVARRFQDVAARNPLTPGTISLFWIDGIHSHNINVGTPYTGLAISPVSQGPPSEEGGAPQEQAAGVVVHEVAHLFFGKFNDGLAEPIANLFQRHLHEVTPRLIIARELLGRIRAGEHRGVFDLESLVAYRPTTTRNLCAYYAERQDRAEAESYATFSTQQSLLGMIRQHPGAWPEGLREYLDSTPEPEGRVATQRLPNPNETRGPVRETLGTLGDTLQQFLVATKGVQDYLRFYYTPTEDTLRELGFAGGFPQLEGDLARWLDAQVAEFPEHLRSQEMGQWALEQYLRDTLPPGQQGGDPLACLDPANWLTRECDSSRRYPPPEGEGAQASGERERGSSSRAERRPPPGPPGGGSQPAAPRPPPMSWREQLANLQVPRAGGEQLPVSLRVTEELGVDFDIERLCSPDRASRSAAPVQLPVP